MNLSPRELEVVQAMASGLQQKAAARRLGISSDTLRDYLSRAKLKLGADTTAQAAVIAQRMGILRDEDEAIAQHKGKA